MWACAHIISTCLQIWRSKEQFCHADLIVWLEQQFESELVLKYSTETMSLRILMDKEKAEQFAQHEQLRITIPEHALLLLHA